MPSQGPGGGGVGVGSFPQLMSGNIINTNRDASIVLAVLVAINGRALSVAGDVVFVLSVRFII